MSEPAFTTLAVGALPRRLGPVCLPGHESACVVHIDDGVVASIEAVKDAQAGWLALPALCEPHVHADRAFAHGPRRPTSLVDAIAMVQEIRLRQREGDVSERARRLLGRAAEHGALHVRSHVDVDATLGLTALRGVLDARERCRSLLDLELVAFATNQLDPASEDGRALLTDAIAAGADLLGATPARCSDPRASIDATLDLALELGRPVDFHLDETTDPASFLLEHLVDGVLERQLIGQVTASHCCALACVASEVASRTIRKLRAARVTVIALPALNLYLQDRGAAAPRLRGLTLVGELVASGVDVRFGSDNVQDVFYPYGDVDPLESAFLVALVAQLDDDAALVRGICGGREAVQVGEPADLVVLPARSLPEALAARPRGRFVLRAGQVVRSLC